MTNQEQLIQLRQKLVLLTDEYCKLSENPAWQLLAEQHPDLEELRQAAVNTSDNLWYSVRLRIPTQSET